MGKVAINSVQAHSIAPGQQLREIIGKSGTLQSAAFSLAYFEIEPGFGFDSHFHRESHEAYICVAGRALIQVDGIETELSEGDVLLLKPMQVHKGIAVGTTPFAFWAVSSPAYAAEDHIKSDMEHS